MKGFPHSPVCRTLLQVLLFCLALVCNTVMGAWNPGRLVVAVAAGGDRAITVAHQLAALINDVAGKPDLAVMATRLNDFFNQRISYLSDLENWGQEDYWASPGESILKGAGDCEDYAIAKYFSLVAAGIPQRKLRLVYVKVQGAYGGISHMVLAFFPTPDAEPWILDNLVPEMKAASLRGDLVPVFSFNAEAIWEGTGATAMPGRSVDRLSPWSAVISKARREGF